MFSETVNPKIDWEASEMMISSLIFNKLGAILNNDSSFNTKKMFFEKEVLQKVLTKLQRLTHEISRKYDDSEIQEEIKKEEKKEEKEEDFLRKVEKRKGVGYDREGSGKKWMVNEYLKQKEEKNKFILHLLKLLNQLLDIDFDSEEGK